MRGLQALRLVHLASGIHGEPAPLRLLQDCGRPTTITGYTEWIDAAGSPATLGWDWEIRCVPGATRWHRLDLPFTNILLVDDNRRDLSWQCSLERLAARVDALPWGETVRATLFLPRTYSSTRNWS